MLVTVPLQLIPAIFMVAIFVPMAVSVYFFNPWAMANRLFALLLLFFFAWSVTGAAYLYFTLPPAVWVAAQMAAGVWIGPVFWFFARYLVSDDFKPTPKDWFTLLPAAYITVLSAVRILHPEAARIFAQKVSVEGFTLVRKSDIHYLAYTLSIFGGGFAGLALILRGYFLKTDREVRSRLLNVFLAFVGIAVLLFVFNSVANLLGYPLNPNISIGGLTVTILWTARTLARDKLWNTERLLQLLEDKHSELETEKRKTDDLLLNILPEPVARELKRTGRVEPAFFESVTVVFTDFAGFSKFTPTVTPQELVNELDFYFSAFDDIIGRYSLEKLKTIGDSYMFAAGIPLESENHAVDALKAALDIKAFMDDCAVKLASTGNEPWSLRIGVHSGPIVAGVIGRKKMIYDTWGDTVNLASRMESLCEPGKINVSRATRDLAGGAFDFEPRGFIPVKNVGPTEMFFAFEKQTSRASDVLD